MSDERYPREAVTRQHQQRSGKGYNQYRACLRLEFAHRCVYCLTAESEVRPVRRHAGFEIDHFRPRARFPKLEARYSNLYWACPECNRVKAQKWPVPEEVRRGYRFVDPCKDAPSDHLETQGDRVVGKTRAGAYTIDEIQLNSIVHVRRRADRRVMLQRLTTLVQLAQDDEQRRAAIALLDELNGAPWDFSPHCPCHPAEQ